MWVAARLLWRTAAIEADQPIANTHWDYQPYISREEGRGPLDLFLCGDQQVAGGVTHLADAGPIGEQHRPGRSRWAAERHEREVVGRLEHPERSTLDQQALR